MGTEEKGEVLMFSVSWHAVQPSCVAKTLGVWTQTLVMLPPAVSIIGFFHFAIPPVALISAESMSAQSKLYLVLFLAEFSTATDESW